MKNKFKKSLSALVLFLSVSCAHQETFDSEAQKLLKNEREAAKTYNLKAGDTYEVIVSQNPSPLCIIINREKQIEIIKYEDLNQDGSYDRRIITIIPRQIEYQIFPPEQPRNPEYKIDSGKKLKT